MSVREVNAMLRGGPAVGISDGERIRYVPESEYAVKLLRGNRYEHFESTSETVRVRGQNLRVFVWTRNTYVAE